MNQNDFIEEVKQFQNLYCDDYMRDHQVTFCFGDIDSPMAEIKCEDFGGMNWTIPVCLDTNGEIAIGDDETRTLGFDGEGFYCYLWHEAVSRIV